MGIYRRFKMRFGRVKHDFVPIMVRQTDFLCKSTELLAEIFASTDRDLWKRNEREIKSCEVQGDALLTDFHEMLSGSIMLKINKLDLQAVSMAMDDCIDAVKDTSKAVLIYQPEHIDTQLEELARIAESQSLALRDMVPLLEDIKKNVTAISLCCERVTELEHAADEDYEDYIGFIFNNVEDVRELIKYKNLAEMLENVTDVHKKISDRVRDLLLNYLTD